MSLPRAGVRCFVAVDPAIQVLHDSGDVAFGEFHCWPDDPVPEQTEHLWRQLRDPGD